MSEEQNVFTKDIEGIIKKTIEINKAYFEKGSELIRQFQHSDKKVTDFKAPDSGAIMGALSTFAELNLEHYKNVLELGLEYTKKAFSGAETAEDAEEVVAEPEDYADEPAFILNGTGSKGDTVKLQFLLDNIKEEKVLCKFVNFDFVNVDNPSETYALTTTFEPQSFELDMNASQPVLISVIIDPNAKLGTYQSKVQVEGFEPIFFLIRVTITRKTTAKK
ncbi:MAG: hypothetical protein HWE22_08680 [Flavobacteriales bacterium]|nr:hypothetical protein [Flavobacteriales bacterium]